MLDSSGSYTLQNHLIGFGGVFEGVGCLIEISFYWYGLRQLLDSDIFCQSEEQIQAPGMEQ